MNTWRRNKALVLYAVLSGFLSLGILPRATFAFQSTQIVTRGASVLTGGGSQEASTSPVHIVHSPLQSVSMVTQMAIIQGQAGESLRNFNPTYDQRIKSPNQSAGNIRVRLFYRFITPNDPPGADIPATEMPALYGPDPMGFAFQVPPSSFVNGILQYRMIAEHLVDVNGSQVVGSSESFPMPTLVDTAPWVSVGIVANASQVFDARGGTFRLTDGNPNDGQTEISIPAGVLSEPTTITVDQVSPTSPIVPAGLNQPQVVYRIDSDHPFNGLVQLSMLFQDFDFATGRKGFFSGTQIPVSQGSISWWDGFSWRRLGGKIDTAYNTLTSRITSSGFFAIAASGPVSPEDRRPMEKIITPNGDGKNDVALFALDNGSVEIFDINGRRVRTLYSQVNPQWDGRDDSGKIVESGVYIYQYVADGKRVSGVIGVAK